MSGIFLQEAKLEVLGRRVESSPNFYCSDMVKIYPLCSLVDVSIAEPRRFTKCKCIRVIVSMIILFIR
jgi:hypothetical protein